MKYQKALGDPATKSGNIPFICAKRSISCVYDEYVKIMGIKDCSQCYANCYNKEL